MDDATLIALDRALEWGARQQPPWSIDAVIQKAGQLRAFLDEPHLGDLMWDRVTALEEIVHQLETELHSLGEFSPTLNDGQPPRSRGPGPSPTGQGETTTTQPDEPLDLTPVDF